MTRPTRPMPPAAVLPIVVGELPAYVLEVFLPGGGTVAVWRGTLRFLNQLAGLASDFFVADRLRQLTAQTAASAALDAALIQIHAAVRIDVVAAVVVDHLAAAWPVQTVAIWDRPGERWLAVGNVSRIDQGGEAAGWLRACLPQKLRPRDDAKLQRVERLWTAPLRQTAGWCVATGPETAWRLVLVASDDAEPPPLVNVDLIARLLRVAEAAATSIRRIEALPLGGVYLRQIAADEGGGPIPASRRRRAVWIAAAMAATLLLAIPIPRIVPARGVLQPTRRWTAYCPADAVVDQVLVEEAQVVYAGQPLVRLHSDSLASEHAGVDRPRRGAAATLGRRTVEVR